MGELEKGKEWIENTLRELAERAGQAIDDIAWNKADDWGPPDEAGISPVTVREALRVIAPDGRRVVIAIARGDVEDCAHDRYVECRYRVRQDLGSVIASLRTGRIPADDELFGPPIEHPPFYLENLRWKDITPNDMDAVLLRVTGTWRREPDGYGPARDPAPLVIKVKGVRGGPSKEQRRSDARTLIKSYLGKHPKDKPLPSQIIL